MKEFAKCQSPDRVSAEVRASRLSRAAFTLQCGRTEYGGARFSFSAESWRAVARNCEAFLSESSSTVKSESQGNQKMPIVVFMFPGQGSQHVSMARQLYEREPRFRNNVNKCCALVTSFGGCDVRKLYFEPGTITPKELNRTLIVQPAVYIVSYCLALFRIVASHFLVS